eukprot:7214832-Heterocapsa_arctica.AAC.1
MTTGRPSRPGGLHQKEINEKEADVVDLAVLDDIPPRGRYCIRFSSSDVVRNLACESRDICRSASTHPSPQWNRGSALSTSNSCFDVGLLLQAHPRDRGLNVSPASSPAARAYA